MSVALLLAPGCIAARADDWVGIAAIHDLGVDVDRRLLDADVEAVFNLVASRPDLLALGGVLSIGPDQSARWTVWVVTGVRYADDAGGGFEVKCRKQDGEWVIVDVAEWIA